METSSPTVAPGGQTPATARQRLLDAAERLFYSQGINSTGIDAVIDAADVARMTLYKQFGGKAGLVTAYLEQRDGRWWASVEHAIAGAETPVDQLLAVFEALERWSASNGNRGCAFTNATAELTDEAHPAREVIARHKRVLHQRLRELAEQARVADPDGLADQLFIVFEGAIATSAPAGVDKPVAAARNAARTLVTAAHRASGGADVREM